MLIFIVSTVGVAVFFTFAFHLILSSHSVQIMSIRLISFDHDGNLSSKGGNKFYHIHEIFISKPIFMWIIDL